MICRHRARTLPPHDRGPGTTTSRRHRGHHAPDEGDRIARAGDRVLRPAVPQARRRRARHAGSVHDPAAHRRAGDARAGPLRRRRREGPAADADGQTQRRARHQHGPQRPQIPPAGEERPDVPRHPRRTGHAHPESHRLPHAADPHGQLQHARDHAERSWPAIPSCSPHRRTSRLRSSSTACPRSGRTTSCRSNGPRTRRASGARRATAICTSPC